MLNTGRPYLAIPGPSVMPDRVLQAMHIPAPNIYAGELHDITRSLVSDLRAVARTAGQVAIYIGNGHAAWEAALANTISPGDHILVLANGRFGHGWAGMAQALGAEVEVMDFGSDCPVPPDAVEDRLRQDTARSIKAILICHVDTSSSGKSDVAAIRAAIDAVGHPALYMVDCIASLGCDRYEMDAWGVDVTVAACQKGLMTPPGVSFVWFGERAAAARAAQDRVSSYWDWVPRSAPEEYYQYFAGTAPTHHIYGLRAALDMIAEEGIEAIWTRHERLAAAVWTALETWGEGGPMRPNIADRAARSCAVTSVYLGGDAAARLQDWCKAHAGVTLGIGLGQDPAEAYFRIGHMGHVNSQMVMGALGAIETGLRALDIPHGDGALGRAATVLAA